MLSLGRKDLSGRKRKVTSARPVGFVYRQLGGTQVPLVHESWSEAPDHGRPECHGRC